MTTIMAWNIQFFTDGNFSDATMSSSLQSEHIVDAVKTVAPDILVVIEVRTAGTGGIGALASGSGVAGLAILRNRLGAGWWAVPPQVLNQQAPYSDTQTRYFEAIGVLFRSANLDFIGPSLWTANGAVPRDPAIPAGNVIPYAGNYAGALPAAPPRGCGFKGVNQNQFAGQASLHDGDGDLQYFPGRADRAPFYTAFWDAQNNRVIKLVSVHLPPSYGRAKRAMPPLYRGTADLDEDIVTAPPAGAGDTQGVRVLIGDFNINASDPAQSAAYNTVAGYGAQVAPNGNTATMLRRAKSHKTPPPLFQGYLKRTGGYPWALDNALVEYYPAAANPNAFQVANWVPLNKPSAHPRYPNAYMGTNYSNITTDQQFVNPYNYGKIRGTSDHLAIVLEV